MGDGALSARVVFPVPGAAYRIMEKFFSVNVRVSGLQIMVVSPFV
jgi:hypothetical protein